MTEPLIPPHVSENSIDDSSSDGRRTNRGTPGNRGGQPGRSGPPGNRNGMTSGVRSYLFTGRLPEGCSYIRKAISRFRVTLESAIVAKHGELSVYHAATIQSCLRHETRCLLLTRYLRSMGHDRKTTTNQVTKRNGVGDKTASTTTVESEGGTLADRIALLREISAATDSRDKCLEKLKLDHDGKNNVLDAAWAIADEIAAEQDQQFDTPTNASGVAPDASNAKL